MVNNGKTSKYKSFSLIKRYHAIKKHVDGNMFLLNLDPSWNILKEENGDK